MEEAPPVEDPPGEPLSPCQKFTEAINELGSLVVQEAALMAAKTKALHKRDALEERLAQV